MTDILDQIEAEDPEDEALRPDAEADFFQHFAWSVECLPCMSSPWLSIPHACVDPRACCAAACISNIAKFSRSFMSATIR